MGQGSYTRIRTRADGRRERLTIADNGRILEVTPISNRTSKTRTGKSLARRRRRMSR